MTTDISEKPHVGESCKHLYTYQGVKFYDTRRRETGGSATLIEYYDAFFCQYCLDRRTVKLPVTSTSYEPLRYGATPLEGKP